MYNYQSDWLCCKRRNQVKVRQVRDIFISHVEEDAEKALQIAESLEKEGFTTWYYERDSTQPTTCR
jgi:hypothetical protein